MPISCCYWKTGFDSDGLTGAKSLLSLEFTIEIIPIIPYIGVVSPFIGSLSFFSLIILKETLTFLPLSNPVLHYILSFRLLLWPGSLCTLLIAVCLATVAIYVVFNALRAGVFQSEVNPYLVNNQSIGFSPRPPSRTSSRLSASYQPSPIAGNHSVLDLMASLYASSKRVVGSGVAATNSKIESCMYSWHWKSQLLHSINEY